MAICSECKAEIDYLDISVTGVTHTGVFVQHSDRNYDFEEELSCFEEAQEKLSCPECGNLLFTSRDEAEEFLKGIAKIGHADQQADLSAFSSTERRGENGKQ